MTNSVSAMSQATHDTRSRVESMATRLAHLINDGEKMCKRLEDTIMTMERSQTSVTNQVHAAQTELNVMMRDVLDQSRARIIEMTTLMRQMRAMSEAGEADITVPPPRVKSA
jgi:septal ring factor EnvC (AmiA/AmiB activator)